MSSILEALAGQLAGSNLRQLSQQLGTDEGQTQKAVAGALPMLLGALAQNGSNRGGLESLAGALDRDHDGSVLDDLGGFFGGSSPVSGHGAGILKHALGNRRGAIENSVSRTSGMSQAQVGNLLQMLAPLVMGALGRERRSRGLDTSGLGDLLAGERRQVERNQPNLGMLGSVLDADNDGNVLDDVAKAGAGLLGKFLSRR